MILSHYLLPLFGYIWRAIGYIWRNVFPNKLKFIALRNVVPIVCLVSLIAAIAAAAQAVFTRHLC